MRSLLQKTQIPKPVILTGDCNSWSTFWGYVISNSRSKTIGNILFFTHIDLTLCSTHIAIEYAAVYVKQPIWNANTLHYSQKLKPNKNINCEAASIQKVISTVVLFAIAQYSGNKHHKHEGSNAEATYPNDVNIKNLKPLIRLQLRHTKFTHMSEKFSILALERSSELSSVDNTSFVIATKSASLISN
uniref:Endonuclease/exonuclease/phosphatase domain-containing protein n=1 Tax=Glossina brevipalpis TaxID=37001 RepID=A0A1A9WGE4_9MUSC